MTGGRIKPLARATRGPAMLRRGYAALSRELEEALFRHSDVLSEGYCRTSAPGGETYYGSTMISCDLEKVAEHFRGGLDAEGRDQLALAIDGSVRVRLRAMRLGCAEAARRVQHRALGTALVEVRVRMAELQLHIDVDLEVPLGVSSGSGRNE